MIRPPRTPSRRHIERYEQVAKIQHVLVTTIIVIGLAVTAATAAYFIA